MTWPKMGGDGHTTAEAVIKHEVSPSLLDWTRAKTRRRAARLPTRYVLMPDDTCLIKTAFRICVNDNCYAYLILGYVWVLSKIIFIF